jgi:hypothetical protein
VRRFDAVWKYNGTTPAYTDYSTVAGRGGAGISVQGTDKLYLGHSDWLSGVLVMTTLGAGVQYVVEQWTGDGWHELPLAESYADLTIGFQIIAPAFDFTNHGVIEWGRSPLPWVLEAPAANVWPELDGDDDGDGPSVPDATARYWVRIKFLSGGPVTIDRLLPLLYNTYATYSDLASFMALPEFDELHPPTAASVRQMIRRQEDWLDTYTRRAWRPRYVRNETQNFNPYGIPLNHRPVMFITSMGLWNGTSFEDMPEGRGEQAYLDRYTSMVYPLTPSFRIRYMSFLLSKYLRQERSFQISYVYGEDFDMSDTGSTAQGIVLRKAAADLVVSGDWSKFMTSGLDTVPKPEKVREWLEQAEAAADTLRMMYTA